MRRRCGIYDGDRYRLAGYAVMNDHLHAVVERVAGYGSHRSGLEVIHRSPPMQGSRSQGPLWLGEYLDRVLSGEMELIEKLEYIRGGDGLS